MWHIQSISFRDSEIRFRDQEYELSHESENPRVFRMKKAKLDKVLKALLKDRGMKASDLSKATGIPGATLSPLLNGGQTQRPEHLLVLSQFFGVSIEFLLFGEDNQKSSLDEVFTEGIFEGWLKVKIERAIPNKKKIKIDD